MVSDSEKNYPIFENSTVLEVGVGKVTIDTLLQHPEMYRFVPVSERSMATNPKKEYWYRFELYSSLLTPVYLYTERIDLQSEQPFPLPVTIYQVYNNRLQNEYQFDIERNNKSPTVSQDRNYRVLPLYLQPNRPFIFYWHSSTANLPKNAVIIPGNRLLTSFHYDDLFVGLYYGFVLIMILYNLLLYIRLKESDYLIYAIWIGLLSLSYFINTPAITNFLGYLTFSHETSLFQILENLRNSSVR